MSGARPDGCAQRLPEDPGPWGQRALLGRDQWEADALRDMARDYVVEHSADDDAVLVVDKKGHSEAG